MDQKNPHKNKACFYRCSTQAESGGAIELQDLAGTMSSSRPPPVLPPPATGAAAGASESPVTDLTAAAAATVLVPLPSEDTYLAADPALAAASIESIKVNL